MRIFVASHFKVLVDNVSIVIQLTLWHMLLQECLIEHRAAKLALFTVVRDKLWPGRKMKGSEGLPRLGLHL